ncbi:helix-turn-helix domain-containing protein [Paenibacillus typhae]|uniref:helix-turn-helix domain-containing protein n=1 Tax=Paenibacillus typhae TaxID=1174501 RepID=UPI001C8ED29E|nr:helix-turn-helix transcriptional regulator [Paenibacillus typhae]MBY0010270.1 helix-turn-helix transcriptional regulator [Paenibacillus typhae]
MTSKQTIGDKIKALRQSKGLTQSELAGEAMTKSMLSQIENGRAMPSMRSLQILAERLGVDAGYFLEDDQGAKLARLVRDIEVQFKQKNYNAVVSRVKPLLDAKLPVTVDAARLMEFYVAACYYTGSAGGEEAVARAAEIYERFGLFVESAKVQYLTYALLFTQGRYEESLALILGVRKEYMSKKVGNNFLFELDLHYAESVTLSALGDYSGSRKAALDAIALSREEGVYYLTDHFYRVLSNLALMAGSLEEAGHYLEKSRLYVELSEDRLSVQLLKLAQMRQANAEQRYEDALRIGEEFQAEGDRYVSSRSLAAGTALYYLGRDEEALELLSKVTLTDDVHHPLDRAAVFTSYAYKARIYARAGKLEEARQQSEIAYERVQNYPPSVFCTFIRETYHELHRQ